MSTICQLSSPSVDGLFALCSLGLVLGDVTLATAAITELQKWQDKEEGETIAVDLGFLSAMIYALQGHNDLACRQVAKLLKRHSHRGELWNLSAELTLQLSPNQAQKSVSYSKTAMETLHSHRGELWNLSAELTLQLSPNQAQKSVSYSKTAMETFTSCKDIPLVNAVCETAAGSPDCLKSAQKSVHLFPDNLNDWATLVASASSKCTWDSHGGIPCKSNTAAKIARFIYQQATKTGQSKLSNWSAGQVVLSLVQCGRLDEAQCFCEKVESDVDIDSELKSFLQLLQVEILYLNGLYREGDVTDIQSVRNAVIDKATTSQAWQFLAEVYKNAGLLAAAEVCYRQALQMESSNHAVILLRLAHLAHTTYKVSEEKEKWLNLAQEAITEALKLKPGNPVALLLQGLLHSQNSNVKHAKRSFQQALVASHQPCDVFMRSVARLQLAKILAAKKDQDSIKVLLQEATEECDPNLKQLQAMAPKD
ncbi:tetratricopeptide repeat protein 37-like [Amphiura filiformis]|uniref:tetratricopeptide repeat protein 37-like n=1 Tax=Amphiura filiformis TaxID=82378 RepID=UPI003B219D68